jgi:hypothetical protein
MTAHTPTAASEAYILDTPFAAKRALDDVREELPPEVVAKAMESEGYFPSYVVWPF